MRFTWNRKEERAFLGTARHLRFRSDFDRRERDYKLQLASELRGAKDAVLRKSRNWRGTLIQALRVPENNIIDWRQLDRLATAPDQVWVGDITYLKVGRTWRYLAVVLDRYSRRVLGWSLSATKDARLTLAALNHAVLHRRPRPGVIFHSDRGVEYAAYAFRERLAALGFVQSMNRPREITDNAHMESFFHSMKSDTVHGVTFAHEVELAHVLRSYIPYYNSVRLHSGIGYASPVNYEARAQ